MAAYMSMDTLKFILHDQLNIAKLCGLDRFQDYDKASFDILLESTKSFADNVMFPVFKEMDASPARYEEGKIVVHPVVEEVMRHTGENGMIGAIFDYDQGGMQLPHVMNSAMAHIGQAANNSLTGYTGLTGGAAHLIVNFGNQELKDTYVPNMMAGKWGGTMCLTEPQAGSSLSDIQTEAVPNEDGSYSLTGQKIFISGGDHEYCENFIHLVLARIKGAPAGTKGISLFVVPKLRIEGDGLVSNDVITASDFQKMGQKGYCTTHLVFGENKNCKGWLCGPENEGLKCMFQMMNGARIDVGLTAASVAMAAYQASLKYAKERPQGRRIQNGGVKDKSKDQTLIIHHPDVRRMLLFQKVVAEGSLALLLQASMYQDLSEHAADPEERKKYHLLLELLTPIAKTYPSEMGQLSVSNAMQVLGGYGYCSDFPIEQYYRDIRIMAIYEGTTGIQSLDLLGRKIVFENGLAMKILTKEIIATIKDAQENSEFGSAASALQNASKLIEQTLMHLLQYAMKGDHERYVSDATIFMQMMSTVVIGWQWLKMAVEAQKALNAEQKTFKDDFYKSKIHAMKFFFKYELPKVNAYSNILMDDAYLTNPEDSTYLFNQ